METIREYYIANYPTDELGLEINPNATFLGLLAAIIREDKDVYEYLGVSDSLIRERAFEGLAEATGFTYDTIYDLWIDA